MTLGDYYPCTADSQLKTQSRGGVPEPANRPTRLCFQSKAKLRRTQKLQLARSCNESLNLARLVTCVLCWEFVYRWLTMRLSVPAYPRPQHLSFTVATYSPCMAHTTCPSHQPEMSPGLVSFPWPTLFPAYRVHILALTFPPNSCISSHLRWHPRALLLAPSFPVSVGFPSKGLPAQMRSG